MSFAIDATGSLKETTTLELPGGPGYVTAPAAKGAGWLLRSVLVEGASLVPASVKL